MDANLKWRMERGEKTMERVVAQAERAVKKKSDSPSKRG
jgi:hypothetical protein